jgi:hypothetical protein
VLKCIKDIIILTEHLQVNIKGLGLHERREEKISWKRKLQQNYLEISGSHGGDYEDDSLLGYCVVNMAIAMMMGAVRTSEMSVYFYETTRRNISESCHIHRTMFIAN